MTTNIDNSVLNKDNAFNIGKIKINSIERVVPHYAPSNRQQAILSKQILSKVPTELQYVEFCMEEVNTQKVWSFELETQEGINVPFWIIVGFQRRDRQDSQNLHNSTFIELQYQVPKALLEQNNVLT